MKLCDQHLHKHPHHYYVKFFHLYNINCSWEKVRKDDAVLLLLGANNISSQIFQYKHIKCTYGLSYSLTIC